LRGAAGDGGPPRRGDLTAAGGGGSDVVIVGGGVIGCSIAYSLARAGARVTLLERTHLAAGASGVAAGMLAPQVEAPFADPFFELALLGRAEHAGLAERLLDEVGLDVEHRVTGILRVARTEAERTELQRQQRWQAARGLAAEWIEADELGRREPLLSGVAGRLLAGGLWLPDEAQVRSPRLVQALATAAAGHGARLVEGMWAIGLETIGQRVTGVVTPTSVVRGETIVLAAGVWSPELARSAGLDLPVTPVKGQVISLRALGKSPRQVIWSGECYLVPRPDGEILLGATEEEGNYDARPTLAGLNRLTEAALEVVPAAGGFVVDSAWAGLRPAAPDRHPIVGRAAHIDGLLVATAHYRNGVLLGPLTGRRVAEQILSGAAAAEFAPFGPGRFMNGVPDY
jgi:glycine oxidase